MGAPTPEHRRGSLDRAKSGAHGHLMGTSGVGRVRGAATAERREALPADLATMLDAYVRYLAAERGLSDATVTAYTADVAGLLDHLVRFTGAGRPTVPKDLTLAVLRSWLARLRTTGAARASLARRAAAARSFTAWAHRTGWLDSDVGARLASPKGGRTLPSVLRVDQASDMLLPVHARGAAGAAAHDGGADGGGAGGGGAHGGGAGGGGAGRGGGDDANADGALANGGALMVDAPSSTDIRFRA